MIETKCDLQSPEYLLSGEGLLTPDCGWASESWLLSVPAALMHIASTDALK